MQLDTSSFSKISVEVAKEHMELRFGLLDGVERTQKEVADAIGISQSYISRLEKRIIRQLREQLGE